MHHMICTKHVGMSAKRGECVNDEKFILVDDGRRGQFPPVHCIVGKITLLFAVSTAVLVYGIMTLTKAHAVLTKHRLKYPE